MKKLAVFLMLLVLLSVIPFAISDTLTESSSDFDKETAKNDNADKSNTQTKEENQPQEDLTPLTTGGSINHNQVKVLSDKTEINLKEQAEPKKDVVFMKPLLELVSSFVKNNEDLIEQISVEFSLNLAKATKNDTIRNRIINLVLDKAINTENKTKKQFIIDETLSKLGKDEFYDSIKDKPLFYKLNIASQIQDEETREQIKKQIWQDTLKSYIQNFNNLNVIFRGFEQLFPDLKDLKSGWLKDISGITSVLDSFANPAQSICKALFENTQKMKDEGTSTMLTGGSPALFIDGKKQLVRKNNNSRDVYYYRFSYGINPNLILKPWAASNGAKVLIYVLDTSGVKYTLDFDGDGERDRIETIYDPIQYSFGGYSSKKLDRFCLTYVGELSDLSDEALTLLKQPFCVKINQVKSSLTANIEEEPLFDEDEV